MSLSTTFSHVHFWSSPTSAPFYSHLHTLLHPITPLLPQHMPHPSQPAASHYITNLFNAHTLPQLSICLHSVILHTFSPFSLQLSILLPAQHSLPMFHFHISLNFEHMPHTLSLSTSMPHSYFCIEWSLPLHLYHTLLPVLPLLITLVFSIFTFRPFSSIHSFHRRILSLSSSLLCARISAYKFPW